VKDYLNINEAARVTGLSIPTIRAKIERGRLPNAHQVQDGKRQLWRIPFSDLIAAGLIDKVTGSSEYDQLTKTELKEFRESGINSDLFRLEEELKHARELLARADRELEDFRQRERQLFLALETKQAQEKRRFSWFRRNT
jgi:excisionase family DNA binding protein